MTIGTQTGGGEKRWEKNAANADANVPLPQSALGQNLQKKTCIRMENNVDFCRKGRWPRDGTKLAFSLEDLHVKSRWILHSDINISYGNSFKALLKKSGHYVRSNPEGGPVLRALRCGSTTDANFQQRVPYPTLIRGRLILCTEFYMNRSSAHHCRSGLRHNTAWRKTICMEVGV